MLPRRPKMRTNRGTSPRQSKPGPAGPEATQVPRERAAGLARAVQRALLPLPGAEALGLRDRLAAAERAIHRTTRLQATVDVAAELLPCRAIAGGCGHLRSSGASQRGAAARVADLAQRLDQGMLTSCWRASGLLLTLVGGCTRNAAATTPIEEAPPDAASSGFALVELFTSEGCSSCPPADEVLGELAENARRQGQRVFPLSFHVDYWDGLGFRDRYSAAWATSRQHTYAQALNQQGMYTPQMVVNGADAFVGSDRPRAQGAVRAALARHAEVRIALHASPNGDGVTIEFALSAAPIRHTALRLALVQGDGTTNVTAGENAGKNLHHVSIVRALQTVQLQDRPSGRASFGAAPMQGVTNPSVLAFLQNEDNMQVLAAEQVTW